MTKEKKLKGKSDKTAPSKSQKEKKADKVTKRKNNDEKRKLLD